MGTPGIVGSLSVTAPVRRGLVLLLGLDAVIAWAVVLGVGTFVQRVWLGMGGRVAAAGTLEEHWRQVEAARLVQGMGWLVTAVLFLAWIHRAARHLELAGVPGPRPVPRAAVVAFLVPVVNVVAGYRVVHDLWRAAAPPEDPGARGPVPPWLPAWWGLLVAAAILDPMAMRLASGADRRLGIGSPTLLLVVAQLAEIAAAVLAIVVVSRMDARLAGALADRRAA